MQTAHKANMLTAHQAHEAQAPTDPMIYVVDQPGPGGAHHEYHVALPTHRTFLIEFQKGPIKEAGVNGLTMEALLAIVQHRLQCFQAGPFPCLENSNALVHVTAALEELHKRTRDRERRAVEGTTAA